MDILSNAKSTSEPDIKGSVDGESPSESIQFDCETCKGAGGYDATTDCEVYDDWQVCPDCDGKGVVYES